MTHSDAGLAGPLTIGALAKATHTKVATVRSYEHEGILPAGSADRVGQLPRLWARASEASQLRAALPRSRVQP